MKCTFKCAHEVFCRIFGSWVTMNSQQVWNYSPKNLAVKWVSHSVYDITGTRFSQVPFDGVRVNSIVREYIDRTSGQWASTGVCNLTKNDAEYPAFTGCHASDGAAQYSHFDRLQCILCRQLLARWRLHSPPAINNYGGQETPFHRDSKTWMWTSHCNWAKSWGNHNVVFETKKSSRSNRWTFKTSENSREILIFHVKSTIGVKLKSLGQNLLNPKIRFLLPLDLLAPINSSGSFTALK